MKRLLIIKASWRQLFESVFAAFSIMYISYIVLRFVVAGIFVCMGSVFNYESFNPLIFILSLVIYLIAYYHGVAGTRELINDIIFERIKQIDAIYLESNKYKISIGQVNLINLKIKNKTYLHVYSKTPLDLATGTKINLTYTEKSFILVMWKVL